jgi:hypothetical protein
MAIKLHAHIATEAEDCDGRISRTNILLPDEGQDDWGFRAETIGNVLNNADENTTAKFTEAGFMASAPTDEGWTFTEITWCEDDCSDVKSTYRDYRAESMGY